MRVTKLELSRAALACLEIAGIHEIDQFAVLQAGELVQRPDFSSGMELYEIACVLSRGGFSLSGHPRHQPAGRRELEMFRLRVIEGLTLDAIAVRFGVKRERVRQLLALHFGMSGIPPAAKRTSRQPSLDGADASPRMRARTLGERRRLYLLARVAVKRHYRRPLTLEVIAKTLASSPRQLQRAYEQFGEQTFREDLRDTRLNAAAELLATPTMTVAELARRVGYGHAAHFARAFRSSYGVSPSVFRSDVREPIQRRSATGAEAAPNYEAEEDLAVAA